MTTEAVQTETPAAPPQPILDFFQATIVDERGRYGRMRDVELHLVSGDWIMVRVDPLMPPIPLAPAAQGLITPRHGEVRFLDHSWTDSDHQREASLRGRIGRVYAESPWVSNLTVAENVTLSQRHHTLRPNAEINAEARRIARGFGLLHVPPGRPSEVAVEALSRAQWVRAFLGEPKLLLLEQPTVDAPLGSLPSLLTAVRAALDRGAAVVWITSDEGVLRHAQTRAARRYVFQNQQLTLEAEAQP